MPTKKKYIEPTPKKNPPNDFMEFAVKSLKAQLFLDIVLDVKPTPLSRPRTGQGRVYTDAKSMAAEKLCRDIMRIYMSFKEIIPISHKVLTETIFYDAYARRKDLDNLVKLIHDAGNKTIWEDDSSIIGNFSFLNKNCPWEGMGLRVYTLPLETYFPPRN